MGLIQLVIASGLFLAGVTLGQFLALLIPGVDPIFLQFVLATCAVLFFAGWIWKQFGWLVTLPRCPNNNCGNNRYECLHCTGSRANHTFTFEGRAVDMPPHSTLLRCVKCSQLATITKGVATFLDQTDPACMKRKLRGPEILGIWVTPR